MSTLTLGDSLILNSDIVVGQEIKTGATFNGKPVYVQSGTLSGVGSPNSYTQVFGPTITNIKDTIRFEGVGWGCGWTSPLPYVYFNSNNSVYRHWELWMSGGTRIAANIKNPDTAAVQIRWIIWYTKTTD